MIGFPQRAKERRALIARVETWVRRALEAGDARAHGRLHAYRVRRTIPILARTEAVDSTLAELAALLQDVRRTAPGPENEHGARCAAMAGPLLANSPLGADEADEVLFAVRWHTSSRTDTQLLRILRDADTLDGLGALGIARAFMSKSHLLPYDLHAPFEEGSARWPAIYCSDELRGQIDWYDRLNSAMARAMAQVRLAFMKRFIAQTR